jgi:hypothetical protein
MQWCKVRGGGQGRYDVLDAVYTQGCMVAYVECAAMIVRMRRAMMSGGCWVSRSLDVFVVRMADVCDYVSRGMAGRRCSPPA